MSWFNTSGFSNFAKSAISQAQKSIDKVLDIKEENGDQDIKTKNTKSNSANVKNLPKSNSYTEGYSRPKQAMAEIATRDHAGSTAKEGSTGTLEDDSFFSSFFESDKHSTPKPKTIAKKKSKSVSSIAHDNLNDSRKKSDSKSNGALKLQTRKNIEPEFNKIDEKMEVVEDGTLQVKLNANDEHDTPKNGITNHLDKVKLVHETDVVCETLKMEESLKDIGITFEIGNQAETDAAKNEAKAENIKKVENVGDDDGDDNDDNDDGDDNDDNDDGDDNDDNDDGDDINNDYFDASSQASLESSNLNAKGIGLLDTFQVENNQSKDMQVNLDSENRNVNRAETIEKSMIESPESEKCSNDLENEVKGEEIITVDSCNDRNMSLSDDINKKSEFPEGEIESNDKTENEIKSEVAKDDDHKDVGMHEDVLSGGDVYTNDDKEMNTSDQSEDGSKGSENSGLADNVKIITKLLDENGDKSCISIGKNEKIDVLEPGEGRKNVDDIRTGCPMITTEDSLEVDDMKQDKNGTGRYVQKLERVSEKVCDGTLESRDEGAVETKKLVELEMEVKRLKEVVDARESKMVTLSKENIDLQEAVSILRNQLEQAEQVGSGDNEVIVEMRAEFAKVIDETRCELKNVKKQRDELERNLEETTAQLTKESNELIHDYTTALKEKEEQIAGLLAEGETLSKKELKSNNTLKKFRAKVKNLEETAEKNQKQLDEKESELLKLKETLKEKTELEKVMKEQVQKLELITDQQEDEISKLKDQLDDAEDKMKGMQTTLDSGYQEINRLSLEKANRESEIEEINQMKMIRAELEKKIVEIEEQAKQERLRQQEELNSLRFNLVRTEQTAARCEDNLQLEIKDLQHRLEGAESRNQELSQSIASASRPLLRQIENLQSSHHNQAQNWEKIEKNLNERLATAQQQLVLFTEKERSAVDFAIEMKSHVSSLEMKIKKLQEQKEELACELSDLKEKSSSFEESLSKERKAFETYQTDYRKAVEELQNEKIFIENQLNAERAKHEAEILRMSNELKVKGQLSRQNSSNAMQAASTDGKTDFDDVDADVTPSVTRSRTSSSSSSSNLIDASNRHASTAIMEKLQTQLRQKDGELKVHKEEIVSLQKTRASLAQELVSLSNLVEELQDKIKDYDSMKINYQAIESRYNAALQLYGEKAEEADELRMDLEDVKQMYKQQIQQLIGER